MTRTVTAVKWEQTFRLINSRYPPIDLFEDIADPQDWELLCQAEQKTNPRHAHTIGNLDLVPASRRVGGAGASYVMAPFTHISPDRAGRFHDGSFGAYYGANSFETALAETIHHTGQFCRSTNETKGWIADMRELIGSIDKELVDIRGKEFAALLLPDEYQEAQAFARQCKAEGEQGIVYPSVRQEGGECFAVFYPDSVSIPIQGEHLSYHWDGQRIDKIRFLTGPEKGSIFQIQN